ncbi:MAG: hypothetical protein ACXWD5_05045, partial [Mycobacterium sp.]
MGAPLEFCSKRGVVAVLASGIVISLTALTGGIAPALAQPGDGSETTTVVAPAPEVSAPEPVEAAPQAPAEAPAPAEVETAPDTQAPVQAPTTTVAPPV